MQLAKVLGPRFATLASFEVSPCFLLCLSLVCYFIHYYYFLLFLVLLSDVSHLMDDCHFTYIPRKEKKKKNNIAYLIDKIIPYQKD
jgi:hypothetical protein